MPSSLVHAHAIFLFFLLLFAFATARRGESIKLRCCPALPLQFFGGRQARAEGGLNSQRSCVPTSIYSTGESKSRPVQERAGLSRAGAQRQVPTRMYVDLSKKSENIYIFGSTIINLVGVLHIQGGPDYYYCCCLPQRLARPPLEEQR